MPALVFSITAEKEKKARSLAKEADQYSKQLGTHVYQGLTALSGDFEVDHESHAQLLQQLEERREKVKSSPWDTLDIVQSVAVTAVGAGVTMAIVGGSTVLTGGAALPFWCAVGAGVLAGGALSGALETHEYLAKKKAGVETSIDEAVTEGLGNTFQAFLACIGAGWAGVAAKGGAVAAQAGGAAVRTGFWANTANIVGYPARLFAYGPARLMGRVGLAPSHGTGLARLWHATSAWRAAGRYSALAQIPSTFVNTGIEMRQRYNHSQNNFGHMLLASDPLGEQVLISKADFEQAIEMYNANEDPNIELRRDEFRVVEAREGAKGLVTIEKFNEIKENYKRDRQHVFTVGDAAKLVSARMGELATAGMVGGLTHRFSNYRLSLPNAFKNPGQALANVASYSKSLAMEGMRDISTAELALRVPAGLLQREITEEDRKRAYLAAAVGTVVGRGVAKMQSVHQDVTENAVSIGKARTNAQRSEHHDVMGIGGKAPSENYSYASGARRTGIGDRNILPVGKFANEVQGNLCANNLRLHSRQILDYDDRAGNPHYAMHRQYIENIKSSVDGFRDTGRRSKNYTDAYFKSLDEAYCEAAAARTMIPEIEDGNAARLERNAVSVLAVADDTVEQASQMVTNYKRGLGRDVIGLTPKITDKAKAAVNATAGAVEKLYN